VQHGIAACESARECERSPYRCGVSPPRARRARHP
jgi:hypothetical protein